MAFHSDQTLPTMRVARRIIAGLLLLAVVIGLARVGRFVHAQPAQSASLHASDWQAISELLPPNQQAYLKASNTNLGDLFSSSVAIDGNTIAIGAPNESSSATGINGNQQDNSVISSGAVYIFVRTGTTWSQQAYIKASNPDFNDLFGHSVALSGNTLVVGAVNESSEATGINGNQTDNSAMNAGAVYVFVRSGTTWSQQSYLKASNAEAFDQFGWIVALDGNTLAVGANLESSNATGVNGNQADNNAVRSGAAYIFVRTGTTWSQQAYLKASNTEANDNFAMALDLSGDRLVVGAVNEDSAATGINGDQSNNDAASAGAAYVFVRSGTTWSQQAYLKASNTEANDFFGESVTIDDSTVAVGAWWEDSSATGVNGDQNNNNTTFSGAAYVYSFDGMSWSQQAYIKASNTDTENYFGHALVLRGDRLIVSAYADDSAAIGINGDQQNADAGGSGAAFVFARVGTVWSQQHYLKASNTGVEDTFGYTMATDGLSLVVGARYEDSNATGIDGNQADNSADLSGAAYVFSLAQSVAYLPLVFKRMTTLIATINPNTIPIRPITVQGETFLSSSFILPSDLPATGTYYLSASPTSVMPSLVDDAVVLSANSTQIFRHEYSTPNSAIVTVPYATLAPYAGQSITVQFNDVYGSVVQASPMYLIWVP
ncbi:MAG TPA: integrin [Herpetosiphon sp.]|uniref:Integrin alpha beta-propellor repeat protein n=1 Tax=Herpetosiphon aurantiacus (strain ATCC 23779 / DSM 785 / 114-95) TaxID=316274 RepID=A9AYR5_HERA2|nr:FG-GAP repeat protein [Herpetosiphon sp.]ABX05043.1 Integrin alpha beta-propellor repeat protein [Herpetosiphon aurantiacus DSM 785]HBW52907.1 integrin [Herpetosiphon sp.]